MVGGTSLQSVPSMPPQTPPTADVSAQHDPSSPAKEPLQLVPPPGAGWVQSRASQHALPAQDSIEVTRAPVCVAKGVKAADGESMGAEAGLQQPSQVQESKGGFPVSWGPRPDVPLALMQGAGLCGTGGAREPEPALLGLPPAVKQGAAGALVTIEQEVEEDFIQAAFGPNGQAMEVGVAAVNNEVRGAGESPPVHTPPQGTPVQMVKMSPGFQVVHNSPGGPLVPAQIPVAPQGSQAPQGPPPPTQVHWDQNGIPVYTVGPSGPSQPSGMTTTVHWMPVHGPPHGCYQAPLPQGPPGQGISQVVPADMTHMQAFPVPGDLPEGAPPQGHHDMAPPPGCYIATAQGPPHMAPAQFSGPLQCQAPMHPGPQGPADLSPQRMPYQPVTWPVHGDIPQPNMQLASSAPASQAFDQGLQQQGTASFQCQSTQGTVQMMVERQPAMQAPPNGTMQARGPFPEGAGGQIIWAGTGQVVTSVPQGQPVHVAPVGLPVQGGALQEPVPLQAFEGGMPISGPPRFHNGTTVQYYTHHVPSNGPQGHPVPHPGQPVFVSGPGAAPMQAVHYTWIGPPVDPTQAPRPLQQVPSLQSTAAAPTTGRKRRVTTRRAPRIARAKGRDPPLGTPAAAPPPANPVMSWPMGMAPVPQPQPAVVHVPVPAGVPLDVGPVVETTLPQVEPWAIQPLPQVCGSARDLQVLPHVTVPQQPEGVQLGAGFGSHSPTDTWSGEWSPTASFLPAPLAGGEVPRVLPASPPSASTSSWQSQSRLAGWPGPQPLRDRGMSPEWTASADSLAIGSLSVSSLDGAPPGDHGGPEVIAGAASLTPAKEKSEVWQAYFDGRASMADYGDLLCELMVDIHGRLEDLLMPTVRPARPSLVLKESLFPRSVIVGEILLTLDFF